MAEDRSDAGGRAGPATPTPAMVSAPALPRREGAGAVEPLDALVRRVDEDRWLASRFAPTAARARLMTLYAFAFEIARTAEIVREPGLGVVRLAWWRDAVLAGGADDAGAPGPLAGSVRALVRQGDLDAGLIEAMIEARAADFEAEPFETWNDLEAYVDATAGAVAKLAVQLCVAPEQRGRQAMACAELVGRAWGLTGLMRAAEVWRGRGRSFLPKKLLEHFKTTTEAMFADPGAPMAQQVRRAVLDRAGHAYGAAKDMARMLPATAFPAIGYLAFEPGYRKILLAGAVQAPRGLLSRQAQLVAASALGRL